MVNGSKEVLRVKLSPEAVDPDDVEMLEDLIVAACNGALGAVDAAQAEMMTKMTGGLSF